MNFFQMMSSRQGVCYIAVTMLLSALLQDFGTSTLVLGMLIATLWRRGPQQEPEGQCEKSVVHVPVPPGQLP
jgi:hypothetical protein